MIQQLMNSIGIDTQATLILLLFAAYFTGLVLWVLRPKNKTLYSQISHLPLEETQHDSIQTR